jgi:hypothetical protein
MAPSARLQIVHFPDDYDPSQAHFSVFTSMPHVHAASQPVPVIHLWELLEQGGLLPAQPPVHLVQSGGKLGMNSSATTRFGMSRRPTISSNAAALVKTEDAAISHLCTKIM